MQSITLYELNNLVRQTIECTMPEYYWIRAEISELHVNRHCYLELIQKDERGYGIIAKSRAQVWANRWGMIKSHFEGVTRQALRAGMEVLVKVEVTFHELYGISLNILDIDPTFTLGDMARRRLEIIQALKDEGVFDMNRELPLPRLLQRIAVISSANAAGYGDFCDQLENNKRGLTFETKLFPAMMQGNEVEASVIAALNRIAEDTELWDVVVIIRGGGSANDLSGFDSLALGENVVQYPIPIITGIGHERDDTIIDLVSHTRVKTPTAAAEFLIHHQEKELNDLEAMEERMLNSVAAIMQQEKHRIAMLTNKLPSLFEIVRQRESALLKHMQLLLQSLTLQKILSEKATITSKEQQVAMHAANLMLQQKHKIEILQSKLDSADPQRILNLGFSITRMDGKSVKNSSDLKAGQIIETTLKSGTIKSKIQ